MEVVSAKQHNNHRKTTILVNQLSRTTITPKKTQEVRVYTVDQILLLLEIRQVEAVVGMVVEDLGLKDLELINVPIVIGDVNQVPPLIIIFEFIQEKSHLAVQLMDA